MKLQASLVSIAVTTVLAAGVALTIWNLAAPSGGSTTVSVKVPKLSTLAATGQKAFDANCARCHGANAAGTDNGPPLVHDIYNPGHHSDAAFFRAARRGTPRHHWPFGDMPPLPQVTDKQITAIVRYIRELQRANGIFYKPHRM